MTEAKAKPLRAMTREDFLAVPEATERELEGDSVVVVPTDELHETGYRLMQFVVVVDGAPVVRVPTITGDSHDVFELAAGEWACDCLQESGLLRFWPPLKTGMGLFHETATVRIWARHAPGEKPGKRHRT
jgi:hypothetical protein